MNAPFLGQVSIAPGTGFANTPIYWRGGYGPAPAAPAGAPMTREIVDPGGWETTKHCYQMPDGSFRSVSMAQAEAMRVSGIDLEPTDFRNCEGLKAVTAPVTSVMAGRKASRRLLGQNGSPGSDVSVSPIVHNGGGLPPQNLEFPFWPPAWGYPQLYPNYVPPPNQRLICRKLEAESAAEGRDVMECHYEAVTPPGQQAFVTYPVQRFFFPIF